MLKIIQLSPTNLEDQPVEFKKVWTASAEGFLITTMSQNDNSDDGVIERKAKYYQETNLNLFLFYFFAFINGHTKFGLLYMYDHIYNLT